jgi:hypothetical protein
VNDLDPMHCDRCGEPHTACSAHTRAGKPCRTKPMVGQRVCRMHGGSAPQSLEAAAERQVEAAADALVEQLWPGLGLDPVKDPVDLLARTTAAIEHMAGQVGDRVNQLEGKVAGGRDLTQLRAEVVLLDRLLDKLLKAGEGMARLGIAERHVQLEQERAALVVAAFRAALEVVSLLPADRAAVLDVFLERLGPVVPGEVVAS